MSEINERANIREIKEVHASLVGLGNMSTYQPISVSLDNIMSYVPADVMSMLQATSSGLKPAVTNTTIISPSMLRCGFKETFLPTLKRLEATGANPINARKAALLATLNIMDFKVAHNNVITENLKAMLQTKNMGTLNSGMKVVMNGLEAVHTDVFVKNITNACVIASQNTGFKNVEVKSVNGKTEVIATNLQGQHLISEISVDTKTNQVSANTETIGIMDGSCTQIINRFNDELKSMNIKIGKEKRTFTSGVCQMDYSKIIDKQDKELKRQQQAKKQQELKRTQKLNSNKRLNN